MAVSAKLQRSQPCGATILARAYQTVLDGTLPDAGLRAKVSWADQNYIRDDTQAAANGMLVARTKPSGTG